MRIRSARKFGQGEREMSAPAELVQKIGAQITVCIRLMCFFRDAGHPALARAMSRLVRLVYGSDVHWQSRWAPGVVITHGFGLAIGDGAFVGPECILFQNVTLERGIDTRHGEVGAPTLEADVHVAPGATLVGPIVVGAGSKVMAGAVLTESVPPRSIVVVPAPEIRARGRVTPDARPAAAAYPDASSAACSPLEAVREAMP